MILSQNSLCISLCMSMCVCIYLANNLPVHLHPCVWLGNDSHSSLPHGWVLLLLHPCNKDTGNFTRKYYRTSLKSDTPWSPCRFSWVHSVSGISKWSLEIPRLINQAGHSYNVYGYAYSLIKGSCKWWLEAESYQLEAAVLPKHPVAGYVNYNRDTLKSTVSVFICVLLPAEAAVKRVGFGEMDVR